MDTREFWIDNMLRIAEPVLRSLAGGALRRDMPLKRPPSMTDCAEHTYLEALGRTLMGVAPWLEHTAEDEREERLRAEYAELARAAIANAVDPRSPDRMNFSVGGQPIVDAAFLAEGLLRAPHELWEKLGGTTKAQLIACMKETRSRKPCYSNWLLFSAIIEAFRRSSAASGRRIGTECGSITPCVSTWSGISVTEFTATAPNFTLTITTVMLSSLCWSIFLTPWAMRAAIGRQCVSLFGGARPDMRASLSG